MKCLIASFVASCYLLYMISGFAIALGVGCDEKLTPELKLYGSIYCVIWFLVCMTVTIYTNQNYDKCMKYFDK